MNPMHKRIFLFLYLTVSLSLFAEPNEYLVKGILIEKITRFITWPDSTLDMTDTSQHFVLGVIGKDPFEKLLEDIYKTQTIKNKPVEIRYLTALTQLDQCHILFVSGISTNNLKKILNLIRNHPILTMSDNALYSSEGVMINLKVEHSKVQIEIDEKEIMASHFMVSHLLLNEAEIVNPIRE